MTRIAILGTKRTYKKLTIAAVFASLICSISFAQERPGDKLGLQLRGLLSDPNWTTIGERIKIEHEHPEIALFVLTSELKSSNLTTRPQAASDLQSLLGFLGSDRSFYIETHQLVASLIQALRDPDAGVRSSAALALVQIGEQAGDAVPVLLVALRDTDTSVRNSSAQALDKIKPDSKEALTVFTARLNDSDANVRGWVIADIRDSEVKDKSEAIPALIRLVTDSDPNNRSLAVDVLSSFDPSIAPKLIAPALLSALTDSEVSVRRAAIRSLAKYDLQSDMVAKGFLSALQDSSPAVQCSAGESIRWRSHLAPQIVRELERATKDANSAVRKCAIATLGTIKEKDAVPSLIATLTDSDASVRTYGLAALADLESLSTEATPKLIELLSDPDPEIRSGSARALMRIGPPAHAAVKPLIPCMKDRNDQVRSSCVNAVGRLGPTAKEAVPSLIKAMSDPRAEVRRSAASSLQNIGDDAKDAIASLLLALKDSDPDVRKGAISALEAIATDEVEVTPSLLLLLNDPDVEVRRKAAEGLVSIGLDSDDSYAVSAFERALNDTDDDVRRYAANSLGQIGPKAKSSVPDLIVAIKDTSPSVNSAAIDALGNIGPDAGAAIPALVTVLQDPESNFRANAAVTLAEIGLDSKEVTAALLDALKNPNEHIRLSAAQGLVTMAGVALQDGRPDRMSQLEQASNALTGSVYAPYKKQLDQYLSALRQMQPSQPNPIIVWLKDHYLIAIAIFYYPIATLICFALLYTRPIVLWHLNQIPVISTTVSGPELFFKNVDASIAHFLVFGFFNYHHKVLDAWVTRHVDAAQMSLVRKVKIEQRDLFVAGLPVEISGGDTAVGLTPQVLRTLFNEKTTRLLIWGEGGAGKTTLAYQIARWGMDNDDSNRLASYRMLPIIIDGDLHSEAGERQSPMIEVIRGELKILINSEESPDATFVQHLLRKKRVLVIVDGFSEMSATTQQRVLAKDSKLDINAFVITSRRRGSLHKTSTAEVHPCRLELDVLSHFVKSYLTQCGKEELFHEEFFSLQDHLARIVNKSEITVLLAKLYLDQLILAKEGTHSRKPAESVPGLMLDYLELINRTDDDHERPQYSNDQVKDATKIVAWECLRHDLQPKSARKKDAVEALRIDGETKLYYLEHNLNLISRVSQSLHDQIHFELDPLAEYLAAIHLVEMNSRDAHLWREFFAISDRMPQEQEDRTSFFRALLDCYGVMKEEHGLHSFVGDEISKRCGLNFEASAETLEDKQSISTST